MAILSRYDMNTILIICMALAPIIAFLVILLLGLARSAKLGDEQVERMHGLPPVDFSHELDAREAFEQQYREWLLRQERDDD